MQKSQPSVAVIQAVAARNGVKPANLDVRLFDVIDPDALDTLFQDSSAESNNSVSQIEFTYDGYDVIVESDGSVYLSETA